MATAAKLRLDFNELFVFPSRVIETSACVGVFMLLNIKPLFLGEQMKIVIIGGTHGNEPVGIKVIESFEVKEPEYGSKCRA